ncbi:MAG TPA: hypothetical protein ENG73_10705 [Desulfobacterales bacterium]|nr:hypothetical protein [Desulfobacterales bacterium]
MDIIEIGVESSHHVGGDDIHHCGIQDHHQKGRNRHRRHQPMVSQSPVLSYSLQDSLQDENRKQPRVALSRRP